MGLDQNQVKKQDPCHTNKLIPSRVILEEPECKSFGIKHSPYVGALKGDDWVSARTETSVSNGQNSGASNVTSSTRTHSDGSRIRTETFSYSTPVVRTTTTTQGPTIRTSTQQVSQSAF